MLNLSIVREVAPGSHVSVSAFDPHAQGDALPLRTYLVTVRDGGWWITQVHPQEEPPCGAPLCEGPYLHVALAIAYLAGREAYLATVRDNDSRATLEFWP